jgi:hypothetical protein
MLASSLEAVHASSISSNATLPDFLEKILESLHPNATSTELNQIRTQWANQIALRQKRIAETNGAVLSFSPLNALTGMNFMAAVLRWWAYGTGFVAAPTQLVGAPDGYGTEFVTRNIGDEAFDIGRMTSLTSHEDVYLHTQLGPTWQYGPGNYVMVFASNDPNAPMGSWTFINYRQVTTTWPNWQWLYIGSTMQGQTFGYVTVACWSAGGLDMYNDIFVDSVVFTGS